MDQSNFTRIQTWNRSRYDHWERFSSSQCGLLLMFAWAIAEAIFWPIVPDFLLIPLGVAGRKQYWKLLAVAILGSCLGGATTYLFSFFNSAMALSILPHLPAVQLFMIGRVQRALDQQALMAFWTQPWSGISFKIFAVEAAARGLNPIIVLPISFLARALRMLVDSGVAAVAAWRFPNFFRNYWIIIILIYLGVISIIWITTQLIG